MVPANGTNSATAPISAASSSDLLGSSPGSSSQAWGAPTFVWSIWLLMFVAVLAYGWKFGGQVPVAEDWILVPALTGEEPVTLGYLWQQNNESRLFLMKVITLPLLKVTGGDFRSPVLLCGLVLGGVAFAMVRVVQRLRGWTSYSDAYLPLAVLGGGLWDPNFLWTNELFYLLPTVLASTVLVIIVQVGMQLTPRTGVLAGTCLVLLPLCGAPGLVYVPPLLFWMTSALALSWWLAVPDRKRITLTTGPLVGAALGLLALYFLTFDRTPALASRPRFWALLRNSLAFLTGGLGPAGNWFWPASVVPLAVVVVLSVGMVVGAVPRTQGKDRSRALGLLFFLGASAALALALAWGRGEEASAYGTLAIPALCWLYLIWGIYRTRTVGYFLQMCLFSGICLTVLLNFQAVLNLGRSRQEKLTAFERDLVDGVPPYLLLARHKEALFPNWGDHSFAVYMPLLKRAAIGPFRSLTEDPPFETIPLSPSPNAVTGMTWQDGWGQGWDSGSSLTFTLPKPIFIGGIDIRCSHSNFGSNDFKVFWRNSQTSTFPSKAQFRSCIFGGGSVVIYIGETIDEIRIHPDSKSFEFSLSQIGLLIPAPQ